MQLMGPEFQNWKMNTRKKNQDDRLIIYIRTAAESAVYQAKLQTMKLLKNLPSKLH